MYTEERGYGSTHEVEALEIEVGSPAMRSKKYACCRIVMRAVITDMFTCHGVRRVGVRGEVSGRMSTCLWHLQISSQISR